IGQYGQGYTSSGDAFSIDGVGTFAAVDKPGQQADYIISVNPMNGSFIAELGPVLTYSSVYGLAGWLNEVYCFDASGAVLLLDINNGTPTLLQQTAHSWWGAGVSTRL
ncbi:MAG: hypothetical protein JRI68_15515, partial [Deltaproteobacteria bacterium]|nr:hypothetical protein [Deltaproteobacteria bacterium]